MPAAGIQIDYVSQAMLSDTQKRKDLLSAKAGDYIG
jgi:hypothetical protein